MDSENIDIENTNKDISETEVLNEIKSKIEIMDKFNQIEVLKILSDNNCKINENKSGVYVNLSFLNKKTIEEVQKYISYIHDQEESLITMEYQKKDFQNTYFNENEDKDNTSILYSHTR
jgi:hypothetical protein